ncbi:hypothetical protein GCM10027321_26780 [Massilia terrae]|uniref:Uncharacterized protein n=1 Tax=Massilia terrae TaxID=1811224 RepID=A0ABT2CYW5_9BURK|nr:hypothetical protein [Massilia terrae]MCS0659174.1 hypothetical protein [Massilia terrae]
MSTTVIGVFGEFQPAFSAKNALLAGEFSWTQVQLNPDHEIPPRDRAAAPHTDPNSVNYKIGALFTGLLGAGNSSTHSDLYGDVVRRGGYVVTVDVTDDTQRAHAQEIIDRFGPLKTVEEIQHHVASPSASGSAETDLPHKRDLS